MIPDHRERIKLNRVNQTMDDLHDRTNDIYEHWVEDDFPEMKEAIKKQIIELKKLLHGLQEET